MIHVSFGLLMQHIITLGTTLFFLSSIAIAEAPKNRPVSDEINTIKIFSQLTAQFSQVRRVKEWGTEVKTSGRFQFTKKPTASVLWEVNDPLYTSIKMKDDNILINTDKKNPLWKPIENKRMTDQMKNIFSWLSLDMNKIKRDFTVTFEKKNEYKLIPKNEKTNFSEIILHLNEKGTLEKLVLLEKNEDSLTIDFWDTKILLWNSYCYFYS